MQRLPVHVLHTNTQTITQCPVPCRSGLTMLTSRYSLCGIIPPFEFRGKWNAPLSTAVHHVWPQGSDARPVSRPAPKESHELLANWLNSQSKNRTCLLSMWYQVRPVALHSSLNVFSAFFTRWRQIWGFIIQVRLQRYLTRQNKREAEAPFTVKPTRADNNGGPPE